MEASAEEWLEKMIGVFAEVRRVLRKDGTVWLNLGDSYACAPNGNSAASYKGKDDRTFRDKPFGTVGGCYKPKDLMMLPHRCAIALQNDGWWVRQAITWCKPSPMPESVTDRCTSATEMLFMLTRSERYFYDADAIREKSVDPPGVSRGGSLSRFGRDEQLISANGHRGEKEYSSSGGRNKRNWWVIPSEAYPDAHFATFPRKLVEPCLLAGTSACGCCATCGAPFVRQVEREYLSPAQYKNGRDNTLTEGTTGRILRMGDGVRIETTGWAKSCSCPEAPPVPCTVLDPFGGSGTVGEVALSHGRSAVLIELSEAYCEMMKKRFSRAQVPLALGL